MRLSEAGETFPGRSRLQKKAAETLQSHVIRGFEAALAQGMQPMEALAAILSWASTEMRRVRVDGSDT
jgi:hypothetical protein